MAKLMMTHQQAVLASSNSRSKIARPLFRTSENGGASCKATKIPSLRACLQEPL